jgi:xylulokinase
MKKYSITFDFGTGSVKGAVIDEKHEPIATTNEAYPMHTPQPGFAEQKVEDYLDSISKITKRLLQATSLSGNDIKGIVISQTSSSLIFADADGKALCDCVTWVDSRADKQAKILNERVGLDEFATSKRVTAKVLWFMENRPEVVANARFILDVSAYLYLQLTGKTAFDLTAAYAMGFIFPIAKEWNEQFIEVVGINPSLLSDRILDSYEVVGYTDTDFAKQVGFEPGTPVMAGCSDSANGQLGTACIHPGDAHIFLSLPSLILKSPVLHKCLPPCLAMGTNIAVQTRSAQAWIT